MMFTALFFIFFLLVVGSIGNIYVVIVSSKQAQRPASKNSFSKVAAFGAQCLAGNAATPAPGCGPRLDPRLHFLFFTNVFRRPVNPSTAQPFPHQT